MTAMHGGVVTPASLLPDSVVRAIQLAALEQDRTRSLVLLEEPECGLSPDRLPALLRLLLELAADTQWPSGDENRPSQLIMVTQSPFLVRQVPEQCLLLAEARAEERNGHVVVQPRFGGLPRTWRDRAYRGTQTASPESLAPYLTPVGEAQADQAPLQPAVRKRSRASDRSATRQLSLGLV